MMRALLFTCFIASASASASEWAAEIRELSTGSYDGGSYQGGSYQATPAPDACASFTPQARCDAMAKHQKAQKLPSCVWNEDSQMCKGDHAVAAETQGPTPAPTATPTTGLPTSAPTTAPTAAPTSAFTVSLPIVITGYTVATFTDGPKNALTLSLATEFDVPVETVELIITADRRRRLAATDTIKATAKIHTSTKAAADAVTTKATAADLKTKLFTSFKANLATAGETVPAAASIAEVKAPVMKDNSVADEKKKKSGGDNNVVIIAVVCAVGGLFAIGLVYKLRGKSAGLSEPNVNMPGGESGYEPPNEGNKQALTRASLNQPEQFNQENI